MHGFDRGAIRVAVAMMLAGLAHMAGAQTTPAPKLAAEGGAQTFATHCVACHQDNGQGMKGAFPPLAGHVPDLLARPTGRDYLIRVLLFGVVGEISINGQTYSGAMPPWESLSDREIAAVLNYVTSAWDNAKRLPADFKPYQPNEITAVRSEKLASSAVHTMRRKLIAAPQAGGASASTLVSYTEAQAEEGKVSYQRNCQDCHGSTLDNGEFGGAPLRGAWFRNKWGNGSVASLFAFTKAKMPPDRPGALSDKVYADLVAYILSANGYKAGSQALPTDPAAQQPLTLKRD